MSDKPEKVASRVSVLDAVELDKEIHSVLKEQILAITKYIPPGLLGRYEPEIDALLRIIIWKLSVEKVGATFGQQILKLKYDKNSTKTRLQLLGLLTIGSGYLRERLTSITSYINEPELSDLVRAVCHWCENGIKLMNILTLIVFFRNGNAPSFIERLLGLKPISVVSVSARSVGYSYMTRELIWHGFIELLVFIIPLINYHSLQRKVRHYLPCVKTQSKGLVGVYRTPGKCAVCNEVPILPHHMGCSHVFCYYCLSANRAADQKFECPYCGHYDTDESAVRPVETEP